jgi:hypothetical protein
VINPKSIIFFAVDDALSTNNIVGYLSAEAYKNNRKSHAITIANQYKKQLQR